MPLRLDVRLQTVADLVLPGLPAADIGTDHAYLPAYLIQSGRCPRVIATDVVAGPYEKARRLVASLALTAQIDVRLGDGLLPLRPGEAASVCLCGMGGRLIMDILAAAPAVAGQTQRLLLQPQKNVDQLRLWLAQHHWRIVAERIARDRDFFYPVLAAEHGEMQLSADEAAYGPCLLATRDPMLAEYLINRLQTLRALEEGLHVYRNSSKAEQRLADLQRETARIKEVLQYLRNDE